jgi:hypothetical protein
MALGKPMFVVTLKNEMHVSLLARSRPFDRACLPSVEQTAQAQRLLLETEGILDNDNLNAMLWTNPGDGGTLQVIDIAGVRWENHPTRPAEGTS